MTGYGQRRRGTLATDTTELVWRYDKATRGQRRGASRQNDGDVLFQATGDPLVLEDRGLAARLYGFAGASRPSAALRRIRADTFGDERSSIVDLATWLHDHKCWSALRSAGEAVALAAERGVWLGTHAPASFGHAVELVRKSVAKARTLGFSRYQPSAWTGAVLFVRPAQGRLISLPASPPRTRLPKDGMFVRDDAFWRRLVRDGDALTVVLPAEKYPTIAGVVTPL